MIVTGLSLKGFRNYEEAYCEFSDGINIICGKNAQGKTNLLEAVYLLAGARSFRTRTDDDLIGFGKNTALVRGLAQADGRESEIEFLYRRGCRKIITVNGVKKTPSALSGLVRTVLFSPSDLELVRGGAAARRRFMDLAICQLRPRYAAALTEYNKLLAHKTRILRDKDKKPSLLDVLHEFNDGMARAGAAIIFYRSAWCDKLSSSAARIHADISGCGEILTAGYHTVSSVPEPRQMKMGQIYDLLLEHAAQHREAELASGLCLSGPHKDEIELTIDGAEARGFASQGQARTAALSLKLAERDISEQDAGDMPVLLLDDVLSELDDARRDFVLNRITGGQVLITCCQNDGIAELTGGKVLGIHAGRITGGGLTL